MPITGGFGVSIDVQSGQWRRWYIGRDGVKRWFDNDQPVDDNPPTQPEDSDR